VGMGWPLERGAVSMVANRKPSLAEDFRWMAQPPGALLQRNLMLKKNLVFLLQLLLNAEPYGVRRGQDQNHWGIA